MLGQNYRNYRNELMKYIYTLEITKSVLVKKKKSSFKIQNILKGIQPKVTLCRATQDKFPRGKEFYQFPV